jgi:hypothetical protein
LSSTYFSRSGCGTYRAEIEDRRVISKIYRPDKLETTE